MGPTPYILQIISHFANVKCIGAVCGAIMSRINIFNEKYWGGNSGGGIFDNKGDIMGIHVWGKPIIGGENHAGSAGGINLQISAWDGMKRNVKGNLQNIVDAIKVNDITVNGKEVESM